MFAVAYTDQFNPFDHHVTIGFTERIKLMKEIFYGASSLVELGDLQRVRNEMWFKSVGIFGRHHHYHRFRQLIGIHSPG